MPKHLKPTRSWLFTPGNRSDRFAKAVDVGADVLIIDLEDAMAPDAKGLVRKAAIEFLTGPLAPCRGRVASRQKPRWGHRKKVRSVYRRGEQDRNSGSALSLGNRLTDRSTEGASGADAFSPLSTRRMTWTRNR